MSCTGGLGRRYFFAGIINFVVVVTAQHLIVDVACIYNCSRVESIDKNHISAVAGAERNTVIELKPEHHAASPWHFA